MLQDMQKMSHSFEILMKDIMHEIKYQTLLTLPWYF